MINIPIKITLPEIWQGTFEKDEWNSINFIVGANGTGKSLFSDKLRQQLQQVNRPAQPSNPKLKVRLLTAERLAGFEKQRYDYFSGSSLERGLDISNFNTYKSQGEEYGLSTSAFVILKERLDIRIRIEALLSDIFKKTIRLVEEGGYLKPKMQNIDGGTEYTLKEKECHGLKEIITLLTFLYDEEYNCIIFDEPELHLHPQFQSFFLNEIRKLAGNPLENPSKKMFFIITHSPYFLDLCSLDDLHNIIVCHSTQMPTYIKNGDLDDQDKYVLIRFLPRFNTHHKQFFFSPNPVFVEGYTDQQIISLLFEKCEMNIAASGASVIDVGGKDELAVFYKLCKKLAIDCRIIADYDAFFRGKLRESIFSNDQNIINSFTKEALGTDVASCIGKIQSELKKIADEIKTKTTTDNDVAALIKHLEELYKNEPKNIETIRDSILLAIYRIKDKMKELLSTPNEIDSIIAKHKKYIQCIQSSNIFIIPDGELEHYFKSKSTDYLNICNKDKLFHSERDFILELDKNGIESNYSALLSLLKKSIPHVEVDMTKHIRYTLIEWIQNVQNAISRQEVKNIVTLKSNARVNYKLFNQLFDCDDNGLQINNDGTFNCTIKVKSSLVGQELSVSFDHNTTAQNFKLGINHA
ncbi:MAG: AAA family ATPase [Prevotellaceae bacterium]|jgi:hypothetical protein|nr:AAA family ATPase [Prevotellaceae bacterium]